MANIAFVIGNGRSRLEIDLEKLRPYGKTIGCNALYRDFAPDLLIATDSMIGKEINQSGYPLTHEFHCRHPDKTVGSKPLQFKLSQGSGMMALTYAIRERHKEIYLIGHDMSGIDGKLNNVYADTSCYRKSTDKAYNHSAWGRALDELVRGQTDKTFYRVHKEGMIKPSNLNNIPHLKYMDIEEFKEKFQCAIANG